MLKGEVRVSDLTKKLIDSVAEETLDKALLELADSEDYEVDFELVKPRKGLVSKLVGLMRDERDSILR